MAIEYGKRKYRLLKDLPGKKAGTIYKGLKNCDQYVTEDYMEADWNPCDNGMYRLFFDVVENNPEWFEELPESQEEKDHSKCSASFCYAGGGYENCTHPDNDFEKARRNKPQKEECKHENARIAGNYYGMDTYSCPDCPKENWKIISLAQPTQKSSVKPSEWINEKLRERAMLHGAVGADDYLRVLCDFLDSHADIFNK